jgi:hypothetical protein
MRYFYIVLPRIYLISDFIIYSKIYVVFSSRIHRILLFLYSCVITYV